MRARTACEHSPVHCAFHPAVYGCWWSPQTVRLVAGLPLLPRPLAVSGCSLMSVQEFRRRSQETNFCFQRDDWLDSETPRTASVYGFLRILHIFHLKVDMGHEAGSRLALLQALFSVLSTTSEIPILANPFIDGPEHCCGSEAFGRISPFLHESGPDLDVDSRPARRCFQRS